MDNKKLVDFLKKLEKNNNREWFKQNKTEYENFVKVPFELFIDELILEIKKIHPEINVTPKECIFRIYKDIRFSKDKTPYKTHISAVIGENGRKHYSNAKGFYIEINTTNIKLYSGLYYLKPSDIEKVRNKIYNNLNDFKGLINDKDFVSTFGQIRGEKYKRVPNKYKHIIDECPIILNKSFFYFKDYPHNILENNDIKDVLIKDYKKGLKINSFFSDIF